MPFSYYTRSNGAFRFHGNYTGPGWSAGKWQKSVAYSNVAPVDEFDRYAQEHDRSYKLGYDRREADLKYYRSVSKLSGVKPWLASRAVGLQGAFRKRQHWSQRPPRKRQKISNTSVPENNNNSSVPEELNESMPPLSRALTFKNTRSAGVGGYFGAKFTTNKKPKNDAHYFTAVYEFQGRAYDDNCVYIGHADVPVEIAIYHCFLSVIRAVCKKKGLEITDVDTVFPYTVVGQTLALRFFIRNAPTQARVQWLSAILLGSSNSPASVAQTLTTAFLTLTQTSPQVVFDHVDLVTKLTESPDTYLETETVKMDLHTSKLHLKFTSQLKVQNRTKHLAAAADETEITTNVEAMPLMGKTYFGKSNGMWTKDYNATAINLVADKGTGLIGAWGAVNTLLQEPPKPSMFHNVQKCGGFKLEPGEIKTSYLSDQIHQSVSTFLQTIAPVAAEVYNVAYRYGHYRTMAFEKVIGLKSTVPLTQPKVECGWEINGTISSYATGSYKTAVAQKFTKLENLDFGS